MFAGNLALWPAFGQNNSQDNSAGQAHHYHAHLTPTQRKMFERKAKELYGAIKAAGWSQRSDHDQYVILSRFLAYSGILSSTPTAHVDEAEGLWKNLLDKNPRWKTRPPRDMNVKEYHEAVKKQENEATTIKEKAKTWKPWGSVNTSSTPFYYGTYRASLHPYDFESYKEYPNNKLKPFKVIKFGYPIESPWWKVHEWQQTFEPDSVGKVKIFALGTSIEGYQPESMEEQAVMGILKQEGEDPSHWVQPNADYKEFYGIISIDGKILARIPFHSHIPDKVLEPYYAAPDGNFAEFLVGDMEEPTCPPGIHFEDCESGLGEGPALEFYAKKAILWTPKNGLRTVSLDEARNEAKKHVPKTWNIVP